MTRKIRTPHGVVPGWLLLGWLLLSIAACSSSDDGGGISGTGDGDYLILASNAPEAGEDERPVGSTSVVITSPAPPPFTDDCPPSVIASAIETDPNWVPASNSFVGNWSGTRANGDTLSVVITEFDIAFGNSSVQSSLRRTDNLVISNTLSDATTYSYDVMINGDGSSSPFSQRFELQDNDSLAYTLSSVALDDESVQLFRESPFNLMRPPQWLQGSWRTACELRLVTESNISAVPGDDNPEITDGISYTDTLLTTETSTLQVNFIDDNTYWITISYQDQTGVRFEVNEIYRRSGVDAMQMGITRPINFVRDMF